MDKLRILQDALLATGNAPINALYDGSDEWIAADAGFEAGIKSLIAAGIGPFGNKIITLQRSGDSDDPRYEDAYTIPTSVWHLRGLLSSEGYPLSYYKIMDGKVVTTLGSQDDIMAEVIEQPAADANWHPFAEDALRKRVEAFILQALNEEFPEARRREQEAEILLMKAQTRSDQQTPPRRGFRNRISAIRRTRRA